MLRECSGAQQEDAYAQGTFNGMQRLKIVVVVLFKSGVVFDVKDMVIMVIHVVQYHADRR